MLKDVVDLTSHEAKGLNTNKNIFSLTKDQSPNMMNVGVNHDGSWRKRLGTVTMNTVIIADSASSGFNPAGELTSSLQAFWRMNEASGTRFDAFGGNDLQDINSVLFSGGINNQAALFVATNSQALTHINTSTLATGDVDFSISAWVYLNTTGYRTIISKASVDTGTLLMLHMNGADASTTFTDHSVYGRTITAVGGAQLDTAQKKFGTASGLFDGTGDYLTAPNSTDFNFGTGAFTFDFFVRFSTVSESQTFFDCLDGNNSVGGVILKYQQPTTTVQVTISPTDYNLWTETDFAIDTWYHMALVREVGGALKFYLDGIQKGSTLSSSENITGSAESFFIGNRKDLGVEINGWLDDFRAANYARWTANFTPPGTEDSDYEYHLFVNSDNMVVFRVSSSGFSHSGQVIATSFGAVSTSTWVNVIAYHAAGSNLLAVGANLSMTSASYTAGVRSGSSPFIVGATSAANINGTSTSFDGRIDEVGFWKKLLDTTERSNLFGGGTGNTFQEAFGRDPWASFDFGASSIRWVIVAAATGIYASSNLGLTWVNIATDRTANYQYFERSKNVLVSGSDSYNTPLLWAGSAGTFMTIISPSAPAVKYWVNHQGFLIGLNSSARKRGFFYEDENTQVTGDWADSFDLPSSADDEITNGFILRRRLYVSTRYFLYALDYVGGNPDWSFRKIKDFGYVPRTVRIVPIEGVGEIAVGLDWGNKIRVFDGADDKIIASQIEQDNGICEFALDKISNAGSGKVVSFSNVDKNENFYTLCLAIGGNSTQTTHFLNFNGRSLAFWPDDNRPFNTMTNAESNNTSYVLAFDRSGRCHMLDSGNKDAGVTPIQDVLDSSYLFDKSPSQSQKNHRLDLFFSNNTSGRIYIKESVNFEKSFKERTDFVISGTGNKTIFHRSVDVPAESNSYQYRLTTSGGTNDPWVLQRFDFFTHGEGIGQTE